MCLRTIPRLSRLGINTFSNSWMCWCWTKDPKSIHLFVTQPHRFRFSSKLKLPNLFRSMNSIPGTKSWHIIIKFHTNTKSISLPLIVLIKHSFNSMISRHNIKILNKKKVSQGVCLLKTHHHIFHQSIKNTNPMHMNHFTTFQEARLITLSKIDKIWVSNSLCKKSAFWTGF